MKPRMRLFIIFTYFLLFAVWKTPITIALTPEEIAKKALDATVLLVIVDANGAVTSQGSGFFVQPNRIATNFHVIDGFTRGEARPVGQQTVYPIERIVTVDKKHNLAILQVSSPGIVPLPIGDSESVTVGNQIYVVGNPLGVLEGTFSDGIISAIREADGVNLFQVTAPISEGNSGGPVLNAQGEVIGVSQGNVPAGRNLNFAIPSIHLKALVNQLGKELLEKGIEQYEATRFNEAIKSLRSALAEVSDPKLRALAHLYLGCSKRGFGESDYTVSAEFEEALRHNPDQMLPPRIGEDHPVFKPLLEKVRSESTGELTVACSLPQTEIWIAGNETHKRMIGTGNSTVRLFVGDYTVEGFFEGISRKHTFTIVPDGHEILYIELPPILRHEPPSRASVGETIPLSLDLISRAKPKQVQIRYVIYDKHGKELDRGNQEMLLSKAQPIPSSWIYRADLPSQNTVGKISYFIMADEARSPTSQYHEIAIVDENLPKIDLLEPPETAEFKVNQSVSVRARVTDNTFVEEVRIHFVFSSSGDSRPSEAFPSQLLVKEASTDIYAGLIQPQQSGPGYIWYYLTATDEEKNERRSDLRRIRIVKLPEKRPIMPAKIEQSATERLPHQSVWASLGLWNHILKINHPNATGVDRGNVLSLGYLSEGKGFPTLGVKLDYSYQIRENINATIEWGPAIRNGAVTVALLGGVARYKKFYNEPNPITPFLGASLKLYPMDSVTVDIASSINLRSFDTTSIHLQHYEMGMRVYLTPTINLRLSYGNWYIRRHGNKSVQIGLGVMF